MVKVILSLPALDLSVLQQVQIHGCSRATTRGSVTWGKHEFHTHPAWGGMGGYRIIQSRNTIWSFWCPLVSLSPGADVLPTPLVVALRVCICLMHLFCKDSGIKIREANLLFQLLIRMHSTHVGKLVCH